MRTYLVFASLFAFLVPPVPTAAQDVIIIVPAEEPPAPAVQPLVEPASTPPPAAVYSHELELVPVPEAEQQEETHAPARFEPGFFSIGLSGLVGTREDARDDLAATWTSGLDVGFRLLPFLSLGARRVTFAHASTLAGDRFAVGGAPTLELALPIFPRIQPYVQVGSAVQVRFGGEQGRTTGVAPFVGTGVRFFVADIFSIAAETVAHVPVTEGGFLFGHEVMPQGAFLFQGGVALAFHIR